MGVDDEPTEKCPDPAAPPGTDAEDLHGEREGCQHLAQQTISDDAPDDPEGSSIIERIRVPAS